MSTIYRTRLEQLIAQHHEIIEQDGGGTVRSEAALDAILRESERREREQRAYRS